MAELEVLSEARCFGGVQGTYAHTSHACNGRMRFSLYRPPAALLGLHVPLVTFLSGLTCTDENFTVKAGAQRVASALGLALLVPDTSPRGQGVAGEDDSYDLGTGAGFYVDATLQPWRAAYNMYSHVSRELPLLIAQSFPELDMARQGIMGHSMGGHGALVLHLRNPVVYRSVSAFSPIVAPSRVPWGRKAFSAYLGADEAAWERYDACALVRARPSAATLLVDQGTADPFLEEQLRPELLAEACEEAGQPLELRMRESYDHSYFFVATFVEEHLRHHAKALC